PALRERLEEIQQTLRREEQNFTKTLDRGNEMLSNLIEEAIGDCTRLITGTDAFTLHDTYGFPLELTREIAMERGVAVDLESFDAAMEQQRERARADAASKRAVVSVSDLPSMVSVFHGYTSLESDGEIVMILRDGTPVDELIAGETAQIVLDHTSFYAEKGGQIGDRGTIAGGGATFEVVDTQFVGDAIAHHGTLREGVLRRGERVHTAVDPLWREEIRRHHTSAHLLQRALKDVLGDEVVQAGSWVGIDRMRFDFRWPGGALTGEQKTAVVNRVNEMIRGDHHLVTRELPIEDAKQTGALTMAGEKYGELVRVVQAGPSIEFCGGTHAHTTGELGMFLILTESSIGSGIRRIESVVSKAAEAYALGTQDVVGTLSERLSTKPDEVIERVSRLQAEVRELHKGLAEIKARLAAGEAQQLVDRAQRVGDVPVVAEIVTEATGDALRSLAGAIRARLHSGVVALVGIEGEKVSLLVNVSDDLTKRGINAGNLLKVAAPHVAGKGGGAATQAQGGGTDPSGAANAVAAIREAIGSNGAKR
ncbi:MAG: alanine--tRNA ligase, partial [Candidatus Eremiobacteraeota bacterium]|nr:alanine--tRNA ligase [Candidatus Eremiobacteraeota bacterium]